MTKNLATSAQKVAAYKAFQKEFWEEVFEGKASLSQ